jgi:ribonuclease HII
MISISSIVAKCSKDREMMALWAIPEYNGYWFEEHKGYWTKKHIDAIKSKWLTNVHRKTFCKSLK